MTLYDEHYDERMYWKNNPPKRMANEFTAKEVAKRLGVTVQTVKNRVTAGKYRGRIVQGVLMVNGNDVDKSELLKAAGVK